MQLIIIIFINLILSFFITFYLVPIINRIGSFHSILDEPNKRKQKINPIVRIGGVSMIISFIATTFFNYILSLSVFKGIIINTYLLVLLIGSFLYFLVGFLDDLFTISPLKRLFSQMIIATWVINQDIKINNIFLDFSWLGLDKINIELNLFFSYVLSLLWIVGLVNAFNWLDGLDGLAAGSSVILAITLSIISIINGHYDVAIIGITIIGICLGFLIYNKYPSSIIMGDGGSNLLGFLFSTTTLIATSVDIQTTNIIFASLTLIIPLGDMFFVIINRIKNKYSPFYPDRSHLHFRLIDIGFNHKESVRQMYIFVIFTSVVTIYSQTNIFNLSIFIISSLLLILNFVKNNEKYRLFFKTKKN